MRFYLIGILSIVLITTTGCYRFKQHATSPPVIDYNLLQEGDLVFRRGPGLTSRFVLAADHDGVYSHIGILVLDDEGWKVIHAVPGETDKEHPEEKIKKETIDQFFDPKKSLSGAIFRLDTIEEIAVLAALKADELLKRELLFDHDYNDEDSSKMYCTELIHFVYKAAGIDITKGKRSTIPAFYYPFILPHDIAENPLLKIVFQYTTN